MGGKNQQNFGEDALETMDGGHSGTSRACKNPCGIRSKHGGGGIFIYFYINKFKMTKHTWLCEK